MSFRLLLYSGKYAIYLNEECSAKIFPLVFVPLVGQTYIFFCFLAKNYHKLLSQEFFSHIIPGGTLCRVGMIGIQPFIEFILMPLWYRNRFR